MKRTRPAPLLLLAAGGAIVAFLLQLGLGVLGYAKLVPQLTLSATLVLIGGIVVALAVPIRRATRDRTRRRVDPFYATRVVLVAKACAFAGALLTGGGLGVLVELLVRPVAVAGTLWAALAMVVGSVALLVAGLVAEGMCIVPPDDDDHPTGAPAA